jgi:iron(III) transport system ATP-binding protein
MSNKIGVMNSGRLQQIGNAHDIYQRPDSRFVADFIGNSNFLNGRVQMRDGRRYRVDTKLGRLWAISDLDFLPNDHVVACIRPEHIAFEKAASASDSDGRWLGTVQAQAFLGDCVDHIVAVKDEDLLVRCHPSISFPPETKVTLVLPADLCSLVPNGQE